MRWLIQRFGQLLAPTAQRFHRSLVHPSVAQQHLQQQICQRLCASQYGQNLGIHSISDWQRVPIVTYDDLEPWIVPSLSALPQSLLTPESILFYEKTSGSSGAAKYIPYTHALRRSFNQMFCIWAHDLIHHGPAFSTGKTYFCISPQFVGCANSGSNSAAVDPHGLQDDSEYLDRWLQLLLSPFLVSIQSPPGLLTPELFKWELCKTLLQSERLETISIWSPSFLNILLDFIRCHRQDLRQRLHLAGERQRLLAESEIPWTELWPQLKLISCWDSVAAADSASGLRTAFPKVMVQGKGLLATEAPLTIPSIAAGGYLPVLNEVFFELEDRAGAVHLLHEVQVGQEYAIILSQKGGLYRYRIGDRVRVTHFYANTPCLEFLGRTPDISDLVGEKLSNAAVIQALSDLGLESVGFKSLIPVQQPQPHYVLLLDCCTPDASSALAARLDELLCRSPHYRHARLLGQLAPLRLYAHDRMAEILLQSHRSSGNHWGDIKHPILRTKAITNIQELSLLT